MGNWDLHWFTIQLAQLSKSDIQSLFVLFLFLLLGGGSVCGVIRYTIFFKKKKNCISHNQQNCVMHDQSLVRKIKYVPWGGFKTAPNNKQFVRVPFIIFFLASVLPPGLWSSVCNHIQ